MKRRAFLALLGLTACAPTPPRNAGQATPSAVSSPSETASATGAPSPVFSRNPHVRPPACPSPSPQLTLPSKAEIIQEFSGVPARQFGMELDGVVRSTPGQAVALTFDACGGPHGDGYDAQLIQTLRSHRVPATLFLNARWITANQRLTKQLHEDPLFELANHGFQHRPLTVTGRAAYGIRGTRSVAEAYDEVMRGVEALQAITGERVAWFRSGTAHVDDVGVRIAARLGCTVVNFDVNVDEGATASAAAVRRNLLGAAPGAICIGHFNQPSGHTAEGVAAALPRMLARGVTFTRLSDALPDARAR